MRHVIVVVGSKAQRDQPVPDLVLRNEEAFRTKIWFASKSGQDSAQLLDDTGSVVARIFLAPLLMYRFYLLVHSTKLWSGKRPLVLVRGRRLASRAAAYAGSWGGGDVVKADLTDEAPLGPTRYVLGADGRLQLHGGATAR